MGFPVTGVPTHTGLLFCDNGGGRVLFESHAAAGGWRRGRWDELEDEAARGVLVWHALLAEGGDAKWILDRCEAQLGLWPYDYGRLLAFFSWNRRRTAGKVICSEAVGRICYDRIDWAERCGVAPQAFDLLSPHDLMHAVREEVAMGLPDEAMGGA